MVGALGIALPNVAGASAVSLSVPSGVVTQTCAVTGAGPADADAPAARVVALAAATAALSEAMTILIRAIVVPSCNKMKQIRNLFCPVANQCGPGTVKGKGPNGPCLPPSRTAGAYAAIMEHRVTDG